MPQPIATNIYPADTYSRGGGILDPCSAAQLMQPVALQVFD